MLVLDNACVADRLNNLSGLINPGQQLHVLGANGAGKSTLLHALAGGLDLTSGQIQLLGQALPDWSLSELAGVRGFLQQQQTSPFGLTVKESLAFFGASVALPERIEQALEINTFLDKSLNRLSGGEQRRVHLARVLMQIWPAIKDGQALLLLDEPDQGLDFRHQHSLFRLLAEIGASGNLVICTHHNLNLAQAYANEIWLLKHGEVLRQGSASSVMQSELLEECFDCKVLRALDSDGNVVFRTF